jgi:hypothetical protein
MTRGITQPRSTRRARLLSLEPVGPNRIGSKTNNSRTVIPYRSANCGLVIPPGIGGRPKVDRCLRRSAPLLPTGQNLCATALLVCAVALHGCAGSLLVCAATLLHCAGTLPACATALHVCATALHTCAVALHHCATVLLVCAGALLTCAASLHSCAAFCTRRCSASKPKGQSPALPMGAFAFKSEISANQKRPDSIVLG